MRGKSAIGKPVTDLVTPAMVVDWDLLQANLAYLADWFEGRPAKLRPHFKSHKCVTLARLQVAAGNCVGITCAKLSEAEVLVDGGVADVLIANQIVGHGKALRLAALNHHAVVRCAVDDPGNVAELGAAATRVGVTIGVLVEVEVGMQRCGVAPGTTALELARIIADTPGVRFDGLQGYEGHSVMLPDLEERRRQTTAGMMELVTTRRQLAEAGLPCSIVSGGGTGTYDITGVIEGIDEVQVGSYALMDHHYHKIRPEFQCSRCILTTIVSARGDHIVTDVGAKGLGGEFGPPVIVGQATAKVQYVSEEHTVFNAASGGIGETLRLIPSHGCTTSALYREMWITRDDLVIDVWDLEGAGCLE